MSRNVLISPHRDHGGGFDHWDLNLRYCIYLRYMSLSICIGMAGLHGLVSSAPASYNRRRRPRPALYEDFFSIGYVGVSICAASSLRAFDGEIVVFVGQDVDQITEIHKRSDASRAMAQANDGRAGANGVVPQINDGAVPPTDGAGNLAAAPAAAPAPAPGPVAGALLPNAAPVHARFDIEAVLLGPLPTKSNLSCDILPKITNEI